MNPTIYKENKIGLISNEYLKLIKGLRTEKLYNSTPFMNAVMKITDSNMLRKIKDSTDFAIFLLSELEYELSQDEIKIIVC